MITIPIIGNLIESVAAEFRDKIHPVPGSVLLNLRWTAPSGKSRSEQAYLPLEGRQTFFSRQVYQAYRDGVVPFEPGVWTLTVTAAAPPEGFRGLGLVVKKEDPWDTEN